MAGKHYEQIRAADLTIDSRVQRGTVDRQIRKLAKTWDDRFSGTLVVWRVEGVDCVLDGQQRLNTKTNVRMLRKLGVAPNPDYLFDCEVHTGLTDREAAEVFLAFNRDRVGVNAYGKWWVGTTANDPVCLGVKQGVKAVGYEVGADSSSTTVGCVATMMRIVSYRTRSGRRTVPENVESLKWALDAYRRTYEYDPPWRGEFVEALAMVHAKYGAKVDQDRLVRRLSTPKFGNQDRLLRRARNNALGNNRILGTLVDELVAAYDHRLSNRNKLDPARQDIEDAE